MENERVYLDVLLNFMQNKGRIKSNMISGIFSQVKTPVLKDDAHITADALMQYLNNILKNEAPEETIDPEFFNNKIQENINTQESALLTQAQFSEVFHKSIESSLKEIAPQISSPKKFEDLIINETPEEEMDDTPTNSNNQGRISMKLKPRKLFTQRALTINIVDNQVRENLMITDSLDSSFNKEEESKDMVDFGSVDKYNGSYDSKFTY